MKSTGKPFNRGEQINYMLLFVSSKDGRYGTSKCKHRNPTQMTVR